MRPNRSTPKVMQQAGELRQNQTPEEYILWLYLRRGVRFRRQHAIGRYIVDFCALSKKLIIELDGSQHFDRKDEDAERTAFLESNGYRVLRFWNSEVMNDIKGVIMRIDQVLDD